MLPKCLARGATLETSEVWIVDEYFKTLTISSFVISSFVISLFICNLLIS